MSVRRQSRPGKGGAGWDLPRNDLENAARFVRAHGENLRYCKALGWLAWDEKRWRPGDTIRVEEVAGRFVNDELREVQRLRDLAHKRLKDDKLKHALIALQQQETWWIRTGDSKRFRPMIEHAKSQPRVAVRVEDLDARPWLLNAANGTIDLRTGKLRSHDRDDLLTEAVAIDFDTGATCPLWERFLGDVFQGDGDTIAFIQRWAGYCLTGDVREQKALFFHGGGGNGKSLLVKVLRDLLGPYAVKAPNDLLTESFGTRHPTELAGQRGKRLSLVSETEHGKRLRVGLFKDLTGGESGSARFIGRDYFEFAPTAKFILSSNHLPEVTDAGDAVWRRLLVVPFRARFGDADDAERLGWEEGSYRLKDPRLGSALTEELPGILAWAVRGCLEWQRLGGLGEPASVRAAVRHYRQEQDLLAQFVAERCSTAPGDRVKATPLLVAYNDWLETNGEMTVSAKGLAAQLKAKGFKQIASNGKVYLGIALRTGRADAAEGRTSGQGRRRRAG